MQSASLGLLLPELPLAYKPHGYETASCGLRRVPGVVVAAAAVALLCKWRSGDVWNSLPQPEAVELIKQPLSQASETSPA